MGKEVCEQGKTLRLIAPLYAGRCSLLTAALQYIYQAVMLGGCRRAEEGKELESLAGEKLRDFEEFGALLVRLGADPVFTACPPYPVSYFSCAGVDYAKNYSAMLAADLRLECCLAEQMCHMRSLLADCDAARLLERLIEHSEGACARLHALQKTPENR